MQLNLNLQINKDKDPYSKADFLLLDENSAAFNFLEKFFSQKNYSQAQFPSLIIKGPAKSGKTHMLSFFAKQYAAQFLQIKEISKQNLVNFFSPNKFYILENINEIEDESLLFHILNSAVESKAFLLLSAQNGMQFELKDLTSRIQNIFSLEIKNPSQESIRMLLMNAFARRQLKVSNDVIDVASDNVERTYEAISEIVKLIESRCVEKKKITVKDIKEIFFNKN